MPQQPTTAVPFIVNKAMGLNDMVSSVKLDDGFSQTAINLIATGDSWDRRGGRELYYLNDGNPVLGLQYLSWDDGSFNYIGQLGTVYYDITPTYSYYFRNSARFILQDVGGKYWDCTPGFTTGLINPTVITTPSATAQTESINVSNTQTIGFQVDGASRHLLADFQHNGWYLMAGLDELGFNQYTSDIVFTYASGFSIIVEDSALNHFKFQISDIGEFYTINV